MSQSDRILGFEGSSEPPNNPPLPDGERKESRSVLHTSGNTGCRLAAVRGEPFEIISTGQRATFGLTPTLSRQQARELRVSNWNKDRKKEKETALELRHQRQKAG
jgi:hypothetical protein